MSLPPHPYPGLRSYDERYQRLFAGRLIDKEECARKLQTAQILVLHGFSGCGKSSFLRACFKPHIDSQYRNGFAVTELKEKAGTLFVRCGPDPLSKLARCLFDLVKAYEEGTCLIPKMQAPDLIIKGCGTVETVVSRLSDSHEMLDSLSGLRGVLDVTPIIIIDQAEELFTMHKREHERAYSEFFNLLLYLSKGFIDVRLCITMRTEYKGQFDDELEERGLQLHLIRGHFLKKLRREALVEAILEPSSNTRINSWPIPFERYKFQFEPELAEKIAAAVDTDPEPQGGILPVVQVVCKRLYDHASSRADPMVPRTITEEDFRQLGTVRQQIARYFDAKLKELVLMIIDRLPFSKEHEDQIEDQIDAWRLLLRKMVIEQPDGRAIATWVGLNDLENQIARLGLRGVEPRLELVKRLSWLGQDGVSVVRQSEPEGEWTLGHDSLGLVILQKQRTSRRMVYDLADFERTLGQETEPLKHVYIISGYPLLPEKGSALWNSMVLNIQRFKTTYTILLPPHKGEQDITALHNGFLQLVESAIRDISLPATPDDFITIQSLAQCAYNALRDHHWTGAPYIAYVLIKGGEQIRRTIYGTGEHESIPEPYLILSSEFSEWLYRDVILKHRSTP